MHTASYLDLYDWLGRGELLAEPPEDWADDWNAASPDSFRRQTGARIE